MFQLGLPRSEPSLQVDDHDHLLRILAHHVQVPRLPRHLTEQFPFDARLHSSQQLVVLTLHLVFFIVGDEIFITKRVFSQVTEVTLDFVDLRRLFDLALAAFQLTHLVDDLAQAATPVPPLNHGHGGFDLILRFHAPRPPDDFLLSQTLLLERYLCADYERE